MELIHACIRYLYWYRNQLFGALVRAGCYGSAHLNILRICLQNGVDERALIISG